MFHATFTVTWPDGPSAIAEIDAESAEANYPVRYMGAVERVINPPAVTDVAFLTFTMHRAALVTGGHVQRADLRHV